MRESGSFLNIKKTLMHIDLRLDCLNIDNGKPPRISNNDSVIWRHYLFTSKGCSKEGMINGQSSC